MWNVTFILTCLPISVCLGLLLLITAVNCVKKHCQNHFFMLICALVDVVLENQKQQQKKWYIVGKNSNRLVNQYT